MIFYIVSTYILIGFLWFFLELVYLKKELARPVPQDLSHRLKKRFQAEKTSSLYLKFCYIIIAIRCLIWPIMILSDVFGKDVE